MPVDRSKAEIERILAKAGADQFSSGWTNEKAIIMFRMKERFIRIEMSMPVKGKAKNKKGWVLGEESLAKETRRMWRAMVLYVKAKLASIESGIVTFDDAFMAHIVLPNKQTVSQFISPQITEAYAHGNMPKTLLLGGSV